MGLFSGGGFLGDIGGFLGVNTGKQERAFDKATAATTGALGEARSLLEGAEERALPFLEPLAGVVPGLVPQIQQSATVEGFGQNISDILSNQAFQPLIDARRKESQSQLASAGLTRSNVAAETAAALPAELAFTIENLLSGRQSSLLDAGTGAGVNVANLLRGGAQDIGNIITQQGAATSQNIIGQQQLKQARNQNIAGGISSIFGGGGGAAAGGAAAAGGGAGGIIGMLTGLFSDEELKTDIVKVDEDSNGNIYEYKYIGSDDVYIGRLAGELSKIRPDAVSMHDSGYMQVTEEFRPRLA